MMAIVDTNVAVVANGKSVQASEQCVTTCTRRLQGIINGETKLVLDNKWAILREYRQNLHSNGADAGDRFLAWCLRNWRNLEQCDLVSITPIEGSETEFEEFPDDPALENFDPDDRKFIAVARKHPEKPSILQAVDAQWLDFREALSRHGVRVEFICEADIQRLHENA